MPKLSSREYRDCTITIQNNSEAPDEGAFLVRGYAFRWEPYQFYEDENGNPVKKIKRHPDIGSHVVIYANATILGGDTVIGDGCVIGGNTWLTHSVPAGTTVSYNAVEDRR